MSEPLQSLHQNHSRHYRHNKFVYPVLSRRSRGLSVGVNLNPDKICNFDCIYCQVDRRSESETKFVKLPRLLSEIDDLLQMIVSGEIFREEKFAGVPQHLRRLNDIAFSGDGEPTTYRNFDEIVAQVAELKRRHQLDETKFVLITNASMFHRPAVQAGLLIMDQNNGEIWAKLDAGTDEYYHLIERTAIPFSRILDNILQAAKLRPLVIQSLFMRVQEEPPPDSEIEAFCERLCEIVAGGGIIKLVQIYTVARRPAESYVTPLTDAEVDRIAETVRSRTGLDVAAFYGQVSERTDGA